MIYKGKLVAEDFTRTQKNLIGVKEKEDPVQSNGGMIYKGKLVAEDFSMTQKNLISAKEGEQSGAMKEFYDMFAIKNN